MNKHLNPTKAQSADLSRRSILVGTTAAAGLALGYSAVPSLVGADQALAAPANFDPSVWYSIAPTGSARAPAARPTWASTLPTPWRRSFPKSSPPNGGASGFRSHPTNRTTP